MENTVALRALHIGPSPDTVGGTQSVLRTILEHSIGADEVSVRPSWSGPGVLPNLILVLRAAFAIARSRPDTIIHLHLSTGGAYLREGSLLVFARLLRRRTVLSLHGNDFPEFARRHPGVVGAILNRAHRLTCLSADAEHVVAELVGGDRVIQMPNPVAVDLNAPRVSETQAVVLFAGVVGRRKGVDVLAEAWRKLLSRGVRARLRIVGPPGDYAPPPLEGISIEGPATPGTVPALIREARVVVLPSRSEGMPVVLAEALAAGRPFIATPVGGTPQLAPIPEALVPVGDSEALASALERYLTDVDAAEEIGERGRLWCLQTRSPEVVDGILRHLYEGV